MSVKEKDKTKLALSIAIISFGVMYIFRGIDEGRSMGLFQIDSGLHRIIMVAFLIGMGIFIAGLGFYINSKK